MSQERESLKKNALTGLKTGLFLATVFSLWVSVVRLGLGPGGFARFGLRWGEIVAMYYVALAIGGAAYGALEPLRHHVLGSMLRSFLLLLPAYVAFTTAIGLSLGKIPSLQVGVVIGLILATFTGAILGLWTLIEERREAEDEPRETRVDGPPGRR